MSYFLRWNCESPFESVFSVVFFVFNANHQFKWLKRQIRLNEMGFFFKDHTRYALCIHCIQCTILYIVHVMEERVIFSVLLWISSFVLFSMQLNSSIWTVLELELERNWFISIVVSIGVYWFNWFFQYSLVFFFKFSIFLFYFILIYSVFCSVFFFHFFSLSIFSVFFSVHYKLHVPNKINGEKKHIPANPLITCGQ